MRTHGCGLGEKRRGINIGQLPLELLNALKVRLTTNDLSKQRTVALNPKMPVRILLVNMSVVHDAKAHGRSMPNDKVRHDWPEMTAWNRGAFQPLPAPICSQHFS